METFSPLIRLVDDDEAVLEALSFMLECEGYRTAAYRDARSFLAGDSPSEPGCIVLDIRMPAMSGLELQRELNARGYELPVVFLTGHGDVDTAVSAMKDGAVDFVQKPIDPVKILASITRALRIWQERHGSAVSPAEVKRRLAALTSREREVMLLAAKGLLNREIAAKLHISDRTVEGHRQGAFRKMGVRTVSELVLLLEQAEA